MNRLKITFLLTCLTLLLVAMGSAIGGQSGMLIAFALACGMLGSLAMAFIAPMANHDLNHNRNRIRIHYVQ